MAERKRFKIGEAVVNVCSMKADLAEAIVAICEQALESESGEQEVALKVQAALHARFPVEIWQVIVGRNFGTFATHEDGKFLYFYLAQTGFCIWAA